VRTVELVRRHACRNASDLQGLCDALPGAWENESVNQLSQWPNKGLGTTIENELGASAGAARDRARDFHHRLATFLTLEPELFVAAQRVLAPLLADVRNTLRAGGVATFADLLRDARDLLRANASVLAALRRRTRLLLVDEFQDTDPVQCDLVRSLALDTGVGAPSDAMPSLFVVGDPKQSIYAWRRADLAAYERFQSDLLAARGETARLSVNYRSTPAILAAVEQAIAPVMIASAGLQPAFETLVSSSRSAGAPVERWVSWELDEGAPQRLLATPPERATAIEARWIAADLTERRAAGAEWKDMAILLRTSGSLDVYLREMRVRDIPYDVVGDRSYYRRREIIEASALVRAIVDPLDHLALLATLRASVVGVPDAALIPLWTQGFPAAMSALASDDDGAVARVNESIARALPLVPRDAPGIERVAGWEHALLDAALKLGRLRRSLAEDPLDVFVERVRTLFLWEALEGARFLGAWRAANLERFFRRLAHGLSDDAGDPHAVLRALSRAVRDERDVDDARPKDEQPSAVQVMTIHKAKGLEFAHVYVASMHRGSRRDAIPDVDVAHVGGRTELVLLGAPSLGYVDVCARRVQQASAERVRTLYVAMTRAKDRLVMAGSWPNSKDRGSHALVWAASAPADAAVRLTAASSTEDRRVEIDGIAYRLPPPIGEPAGATTSGLANAVDARAAEIDSTRLAELRRAASARMSRPFAEAASIAPEIDDGARVPERARGADGAPVDRAVTRAVGTAIHRALEELDAREGRDADVRARRDGLRAILARLVSERELAPAISAAESIFDRFVAGALFARLRALAGHVIAREMPLVSIPLGDDGAVGYVGGAVDLLYRDPDTRELVVADYKTDAVRTRDEALARAPHHAAQAKAYRRAVREALELEREPRFELWFLQADAIVPLPS
jgi:ATP-dependent helicase/nuclease subunit A